MHATKIQRALVPDTMGRDFRRPPRHAVVEGADRNRPDAAGPLRRRSARAVAPALAAVAACALAGCGGGHRETRQPQVVSKTFVSVADSYVRAEHPHTNYGNNSEMFVDGSPHVRAYLSFQPIGRSSKIVSATVRVYSLSTSGDGFQVHATTGQWSEAGVTYDNAPLVGRLLNLSGPLVKDQWTSIDVTSFVRKHPTAVPLVLTAIGPTALTLASRGDEPHAPRLVVKYNR
jgi:hypothetical protein